MKFSTLPMRQPPASLEEVLTEAAKRGFDGVELYEGPPTLPLLRYGFDKAAAKKAKELVASKKLVIPDIAHGSVGTTENDLILLKVAMEAATALDVKLIRTSIGIQTPFTVPFSQQLANGIQNLRQAAKMAEDYGIVLGLDNFYALTVVDNVNIVKRVNSPNVKIFIDAGNCVAHGEDLIKSARTAGELLVHGHVKEPLVYGRGANPPLPGFQGTPAGEEDHAELGSTGLIDWEAYMKVLKEIGFKGFLSVESRSIERAGQQDWDKAQRSMNYLRKICQKVGV